MELLCSTQKGKKAINLRAETENKPLKLDNAKHTLAMPGTNAHCARK